APPCSHPRTPCSRATVSRERVTVDGLATAAAAVRAPFSPDRGLHLYREAQVRRYRGNRPLAATTPKLSPSRATAAHPSGQQAPWKDSARTTSKTAAWAKPPRTRGRPLRSTGKSTPPRPARRKNPPAPPDDP